MHEGEHFVNIGLPWDCLLRKVAKVKVNTVTYKYKYSITRLILNMLVIGVYYRFRFGTQSIEWFIYFLYCFISLKQGKRITVYTWVNFTRLYSTHFGIISASPAIKKSSFLCNVFSSGQAYDVQLILLWRRHIYAFHLTNTTNITLFAWISSIRWYAN